MQTFLTTELPALQVIKERGFLYSELPVTEMLNKNVNEIQEMLFKKGINFNNYPIYRKRGLCYVKKEIDNSIPVFSKDRKYIEQFVYVRED